MGWGQVLEHRNQETFPAGPHLCWVSPDTKTREVLGLATSHLKTLDRIYRHTHTHFRIDK